MKTVTVRELRNSFSMLEAWLAEGEEIRIEKRGRAIGILTPCTPSGAEMSEKPDFDARRKAIWGDRVFSEAEVAAMRADELAGEFLTFDANQRKLAEAAGMTVPL